MIRLCGVLAVIVVIGSATATAYDRQHERIAAVERYTSCTFVAARKLTWKDGSPDALARKAIFACEAVEAALEGLLPLGARERLRSTMLHEVAETISRVREAGAWSEQILCAACGMQPVQDKRLQLWRPYRQ